MIKFYFLSRVISLYISISGAPSIKGFNQFLFGNNIFGQLPG
jgi:hypothetical protein